MSGSASQSLYTDSPLPITENVVLVIPNYRLSSMLHTKGVSLYRIE
jgi:carboxylesterase type B